MEFDKIGISRAENCPVCGSRPTTSPPLLEHKLVNELCGRSGKRVFAITPKKDLELDINELHKILKSRGLKIKVKTALGLSFRYNLNVTVSILKSGIMIIEGPQSEEEAYGFYSRLIVDEFEVPPGNMGARNLRGG